MLRTQCALETLADALDQLRERLGFRRLSYEGTGQPLQLFRLGDKEAWWISLKNGLIEKSRILIGQHRLSFGNRLTKDDSWMRGLLLGLYGKRKLRARKRVLEKRFRRSNTEAAATSRQLLRKRLSDQRQRKTGVAKLLRERFGSGDPTNDFKRPLADSTDIRISAQRLEA